MLTELTLLRDALASPSTTDDIKSYDLVWLIHLVGDVHQPLHAVARFRHNNTDGDNGGNDVKLNCAAGVFCASSLHAEWDGVLGNTHNFDVVTSKGTTLNARPVPPGAEIADPKAWADESMALARSDVCSDPDGAALSDPRADIGSACMSITPGALRKRRSSCAARRLAALTQRRPQSLTRLRLTRPVEHGRCVRISGTLGDCHHPAAVRRNGSGPIRARRRSDRAQRSYPRGSKWWHSLQDPGRAP